METIKHVKMKEKIKKEYLMENEKTTRDKTIQEKPYQRDKYLGFSPSYDIQDHSWSGPEKNLNKWTNKQEK